MISLVIAVFCSSIINWVFRKFSYYKIEPFKAILINYLTCSVIGQLMGQELISSPHQLQQPYFWFCLFLGVLFIFIFFCMAKTTEHYGIAVNAVSAKMGLIFPTLFFFIYLQEQISGLQWLGIILALAAVFFINKKQNNNQSKAYYFPILVFLGSGIIDTCMKWIDLKYLNGASPLMPTTIIFSGAFITGLLFMLFSGNWKFTSRDIIAGILLGIPNYFSIYFLLLAIQELSNMNTGGIFALNNVGVILISTLGSIVLFKDSLSKKQYFGLFLSILTLLISTYAF